MIKQCQPVIHTYLYWLVLRGWYLEEGKKTTTWMSFFMRNDFIFISSITILHYRISIYFGCHKICKIGKMSSIFNLCQFNIFCDLKKIAKKVIIRSSRKLPDVQYVLWGMWRWKEIIYLFFISSITIWHFIFFSL